MGVDQFISAQRQVIGEIDFDEYLPTLCVETPREVTVDVLLDDFDLDGVEAAAREWALKLANKNDYFLAFRVDESRIKVVARIGMVTTECLVAIN